MEKIYRIAVVADTHIPDRRAVLHEALLPTLRELQPDLIFHAGDMITPHVIRSLETVAPVIPVRGNRDFLFFRHVPLVKLIQVHDVVIALVHGHAGFIGYMINKVRMLIWQYRLNWFLPWLMAAGQDADVIVFGHTHRALNEMIDGKLFFNPGSVNVPPQEGGALSFGVLEIEENGTIQGEVRVLHEFDSTKKN
jgi:putative phosphoesterase